MREGKGGGVEAGEGGVGGELDEVRRVLGAEFGVVGGEFAGDGFDFAEGDASLAGDELVDAAGEGEGPAVVDDAAGDGDFEEGVAALGGGLGAELVVPVGAELGAPEAGGGAEGIAGAEGELGELTNAQAGGALVEVEVLAWRLAVVCGSAKTLRRNVGCDVGWDGIWTGFTG